MGMENRSVETDRWLWRWCCNRTVGCPRCYSARWGPDPVRMASSSMAAVSRLGLLHHERSGSTAACEFWSASWQRRVPCTADIAWEFEGNCTSEPPGHWDRTGRCVDSVPDSFGSKGGMDIRHWFAGKWFGGIQYSARHWLLVKQRRSRTMKANKKKMHNPIPLKKPFIQWMNRCVLTLFWLKVLLFNYIVKELIYIFIFNLF